MENTVMSNGYCLATSARSYAHLIITIAIGSTISSEEATTWFCLGFEGLAT
jgi:hypothetical protein